MTKTTTPHIGKKIERIRLLKGMKQETLAARLGVTPEIISLIEQSDIIEDIQLEQIAIAFGMSIDTIRNFNEDALLNVQNNYDTANANINSQINYTFYPVEKIVELYERLILAEKGKVQFLEELLKKERRW